MIYLLLRWLTIADKPVYLYIRDDGAQHFIFKRRWVAIFSARSWAWLSPRKVTREFPRLPPPSPHIFYMSRTARFGYFCHDLYYRQHHFTPPHFAIHTPPAKRHCLRFLFSRVPPLRSPSAEIMRDFTLLLSLGDIFHLMILPYFASQALRFIFMNSATPLWW